MAAGEAWRVRCSWWEYDLLDLGIAREDGTRDYLVLSSPFPLEDPPGCVRRFSATSASRRAVGKASDFRWERL